MIADLKKMSFDRLLPLALERLRSRDEDAVAETQASLWESLSLHTGDEDGEHVRRAVRAGEKSRRMRSFIKLDSIPYCNDNLASCAIVDDLLAVLPETQRRAFVYHCLEGLSTEATGELLD